MTRPRSPSSDCRLLVEGHDDEHVIRKLWDRHSPEPTFDIQNKEGFTNLHPSISSEVKAPGRRVIGIVVDANKNVKARWNAVTDQLRKADIKPPSSPDPTGTIIEGQDDRPRVGIWLMPNNTAPGELEDFVIQMIPKGDLIWPRAQGYIDDIPEAERKFSEGKTQRAQLHAWLATREDPRQMGLAIVARDLKINGTLCKNFLAWLTRLFT